MLLNDWWSWKSPQQGRPDFWDPFIVKETGGMDALPSALQEEPPATAYESCFPPKLGQARWSND